MNTFKGFRPTIIAYDPGHTPGTGLVRNENLVVNFLWKTLAPALRLMLPGSNTPEAAGHFLAKLALGQIRPPPGRIYAALRSGIINWPEPSELARRDNVRDALWSDSAVLAGLRIVFVIFAIFCEFAYSLFLRV